MLALSEIRLSLNGSKWFAARKWTPSEVIHLCDGIIEWKLFVFLDIFWVETDIFDIQIIQLFPTGFLCALNMGHVPVLNVISNHSFNARMAEVMFAAWQKEKFIS